LQHVTCIGLAGIGLSYSDSFRPQVRMAFEGGWDFVFAGFLLFAMLLGTSRFEAWTRPRWLLFFGDISYGLYLIHVLVFMVYRRFLHPGDDLRSILIEFGVCVSMSIALAMLSRFTVEEYFLRMKDRPLIWRPGVYIIFRTSWPMPSSASHKATKMGGFAQNVKVMEQSEVDP
jgi:peptidoglycan/LPS O-acetylase OafA/YrhL